MLSNLKQIYTMLEDINRKIDSNGKIDLLRIFLNEPIFGEMLRKVLMYTTDKSKQFKLKRINKLLTINSKKMLNVEKKQAKTIEDYRHNIKLLKYHLKK